MQSFSLFETFRLLPNSHGKTTDTRGSRVKLDPTKDSKTAAERAVQRFDGAWVDNRQIKLEVVARRLLERD